MANPYDQFVNKTPTVSPPPDASAATLPVQPVQPTFGPRAAPVQNDNPYGQFVNPPVQQTDQSASIPMVQPTPPTPGSWGPIIDDLKSLGTAGESAVANVVGLPRMLGNWIDSQFDPNNQATRWMAHGMPTADQSVLPTTPEARQAIVGKTGLDYVPSTALGRIGQKGAEFGLTTLLSGQPEAAVPSLGGGTMQQLAKELDLPEWLQTIMGIAVPIVTHGGLAARQELKVPTTEAGTKVAAQKVLEEVAGGPPDGGPPGGSGGPPGGPRNPLPPINPPIIPGADQSLGMATDNPYIRAFEKSRFSQTSMAPEWARIQKNVSEATIGALDQGVATMPNRAGSVMQMENTGGELHQHMLDAKDAAHADQTAKWNVVDPTNILTTPVAPIADAMTTVKKDLGAARGDLFPGYVDKVISQWGPATTLNEVKGLRTRVLNDMRAAQSPTNPNPNLVDALSPIEQALRNTMNNMASSEPGQQAALDAARATTRNFHEIYDNKQVARTLNGLPSKAGNILNTPEGVDAYHAATGGSPAALATARKYFMAGLARDAIGQDGNLSAAAFNNSLRDNQSLLNDRRYFTADQADVLDKAGQQLNSLQQTPRAGMAGTSPTYQLLSGQQYAEALVGKQAAKFANMAGRLRTAASMGLGHVVGSSIPLIGSPLGMAAGWAVSKLPGIPYAAAGQKVLEMVDQALAYPDVATELRNFRNNPTTKTMTPRITNLLAPPTYPGYQPPPP